MQATKFIRSEIGVFQHQTLVCAFFFCSTFTFREQQQLEGNHSEILRFDISRYHSKRSGRCRYTQYTGRIQQKQQQQTKANRVIFTSASNLLIKITKFAAMADSTGEEIPAGWEKRISRSTSTSIFHQFFSAHFD